MTNKIRNNRLFTIALLIVVLCSSLFCNYVAAEGKTIRVGYFAFEGYHNQDEDGNKSGYGYEYLQQMARYTGWNYEYKGYDKSWSDAQKMLENGEIDILTSAQKTPEREKIFDFSDSPIGYSSILFTIKAGNTKYEIGNYSSFNGIRVGMIENNSRNDSFATFAKEKGFTYEPKFYKDTNSLIYALNTGAIDSIVTSSLRVIKGEWIVAEFNSSPYYVCTKKGNTALMAQINDAIGKINYDNPSLQNELENKYYSTDSSEAIAFTSEERAYINNRIENNQKLKVMVNPDRVPLSYYNDGKLCGIFGEVTEKILERTGLPYEAVAVADRNDYTQKRLSHNVDLCLDMRLDFNQGENEGYRLTDSYNKASVSRVTRGDFNGEVKTIAAIKNSDIATHLKREVYNDAEISYYLTVEQCIEAVKAGKEDATFLYTYVAEKAVDESFAHSLTATLVPDFTTDFCIGIGDKEDAILFSIINKSVESIDKNWLDETTIKYTEKSAENISLAELIYMHPLVAMVASVVTIALIGTLLFLLYKQRMEKKDKESAKEIQRLFGYVCKANEKVLEVNLEQMKYKEYVLNNNTIHIEEGNFKTEGNYEGFMLQEDYDSLTKAVTLEKLHKIINNGEEFVFEGRSKATDGSYRWYIFTIHGMIPDQYHPCSFMLFKRDINDLKENEEKSRKALMEALQVAKEASEAKGSFMSRMSHEIRTPLNAVIGYLGLTEECVEKPAMVRDYVTKCQSAAKHLLNIINDVLDISAIESGKIKIANEEFDIKNTISSIALMFYNQAKEKGVDFHVEINDMTEEYVIGDQLRVNQILMNLLSNAMKFTPKGGAIKLSITQIRADDRQVGIRFQVSDTGIGMSKEFMSRIFTPFEQEKPETARKYGGSGLGLSITNNLVTMMQGSIRVDSEEGKGTTFTVHLVFQKTNTAKKVGNGDFSKLRALIVDDEKRSCDYMKGLLKRCKVKSDVVQTGEAAVRQIMKREGTDYEYDFCLLDWNLPGIDGVETAREIREQCHKNMPIIIATAYDINEIREAASKVGVTKLISKPLFQSSMFDLLVDSFGKYDPEANTVEDSTKLELAGIRVLLAEDNEMNMEIAVSILEKSGLIVDKAFNGKEALDKFTASDVGRYQVILMDIQMPVMDGYEATRAIRASQHNEAKTIPIIAMTANAFTEDVTAALSSGMNDHISKPVNYDKLYKLLLKYINKEVKGNAQG